MLRIGPNATSDENSAINIREDNQRVGIQKNPTGEYILDVSGVINCDAIFVGGTQFTGSSGGGGVWTQHDTTGDISYGGGTVSISGDLHVMGDISGYVHVDKNSYSSTTLVPYSPTLSSSVGAVTVGGGLNVSGAVTLQDTLEVSNAVTFNSSLDVVGAVTMDAGLNVSGKLTVGGDVSANVFYGDGSNLTGISSSWVGTAESALNMGSNNITNVGSITATGTVSANSFAGNGSSLTGISSSWVGTADSALNMGSNNITNVGSITATGTVSANSFAGDGSSLTGISSGWVGTATSDLDMGAYNISTEGNIQADQVHIVDKDYPTTGAYLRMHGSWGGKILQFWVYNGGTFQNMFQLDGNNNSVQYNYTLVNGSDNRLKHNESDLNNSLDLLMQLKPQKYLKTKKLYDENYTLTTDESGNYTNLQEGDSVFEEIGIIAQDLEQIPDLSFCVKTPREGDTEDTYSVAYNNLFVLHIKATQELKAKNDALQTSHDALQTELTDLKALLQSKGLLD